MSEDQPEHDELAFLGKLFGGVGNMGANLIRQGLSKINLGDPTDYVLQLIASAVGGGASFIDVSSDSQDLLFESDGRPVGPQQLQDLYSNLKGSSVQLRKLALGLNAAFGTEIDQILVESWDGQGGARLMLRTNEQKVDVLRTPPSANPKVTMRIRLMERGKLRKVTKFVTRFTGSGLLPEGEAIQSRCQFAGPVISVNKLKVNQPIDLAPCLIWRVLTPEQPMPSLELRALRPRRGVTSERTAPGPFYAVLALAGRPGPLKGLTCVAGGATVPAPNTDLLFSGASVVAAAGGLETDTRHAAVLPNATFTNLADIIRQELVLMALQLLDGLESLSSDDKVEAAPIFDDLARYLEARNEPARTEKVLRTILEVREKTLSTGHPDLIDTRYRLADFLRQQGRAEEAKPIYERLIPAIQSIGQNHLSKHRIEEAVNEFQKALELKLSISRDDDPELARQFHELGEICKEHRHAAAEDLYRRALAIRERGDNLAEHVATLHGLADTYRSRKLYGEAETLGRRALELMEKAHGSDSNLLVPHLKLLGEIVKGLGRYAEGTDLDSRAMMLKYKRK